MQEIHPLAEREEGAADLWNIVREGSEDVKVATAVQSFHDHPLHQHQKFQMNSPEHQVTSERKYENYRNPICDTTTVSSKKNQVSHGTPPIFQKQFGLPELQSSANFEFEWSNLNF